jgi:hypothetical protein
LEKNALVFVWSAHVEVTMEWRMKMPTDKTVVEEHKEQATVVFDDSLKGKKIDAIDTPLGVDFADQGHVAVPQGAKNLLVGSHKYTTAKFSKYYDGVEWMCSKCKKMHRKDVGCG